MNLFQKYRRAKYLRLKTSRGKNRSWYVDPIEHEEQLHYIVTSPRDVELYHFEKSSGTWTYLSLLTYKYLFEEDNFQIHLAEVLEKVTFEKKTGVGVVVMDSHELTLREGRKTYSQKSWQELSKLLDEDAQDVLDDPQANSDDFLKRIFPLNPPQSDAGESTSYLVGMVKEQYGFFLKKWRDYGNEHNLPVTTSIHSGPIICTNYLADLLPEKANESVLVFLFEGFTFLAFVNQAREIVFYRNLPNFGSAYPRQLSTLLENTASQIEFENFQVFVSSCQEDKTTAEALFAKLENEGFLHSCSLFDWNLDSSYPRIEMAAVSHLLGESENRDEVAFQSFLDISPEEVANFPAFKEMRLLNMGGYVSKAMLALFAGVLVLIGIFASRHFAKEEWRAEPVEGKVLGATIMMLQKTDQEQSSRESLLQERSKSWEAMNFLTIAFPYAEGFIIEEYNHQVKPIPSQNSHRVGLLKTWKVKGRCLASGRARLDEMSSIEGMTKIFAEVSAPSYELEQKTRNLFVNIETSQAEESDSRYTLWFSADISQRIESDDSLALDVK